MHNLANCPGDYKTGSAVERLPYRNRLLMDYRARRIAAKYNVNITLARVVAELVGASFERRS